MGGYIFVEGAIALKLLFFVLAAPGLALAVRIPVTGVVAWSWGIEVRTLLRNHRVSWNEIAGFDFVTPLPSRPRPGRASSA